MKALTFITTVSLTLAGTIVFAQNISYDFDKATDFSRFKTYSWVRGTALPDELNHRRIVNAVDAELAARGFVRAASGRDAADVIVAYHASFDRDLQITGFSNGWAGYRFPATRTGTARVDALLMGTLAVDIVNARTNAIVWRGVATKEVDVDAKPEARERNINKAVEKLFKRFPVPAAKF